MMMVGAKIFPRDFPILASSKTGRGNIFGQFLGISDLIIFPLRIFNSAAT
jgi:hypothetical protein